MNQHALDKNITGGMLMKFALPTIISMVFMSIYSVVDGAFVSQFVGTNALSAVNIVMPLITVTIALGTMLGTGGNAVVARKMGEGREPEARRDFSMLTILALAIGLVFTVIGFLFLQPLLRLMGANDAIFSLCYEYAVVTLYFIPMTMLGMLFQVFFITAGKAHLGLAFSVMGGLCNIILDYVFIVPLRMGISGAALATGIGYSVPGMIGFFYFAVKRRGLLFFVRPRFDGRVILKSCTNGSSEMITNLSMGIVTLLLNIILMQMEGENGVAAITIILYAQYLLSSAYMGYSMGIAPVISYNYGKRDYDRLKKIHRISKTVLLISSVFTFGLSLAFAEPLVAIFSPAGTAVYQMAVQGFRIFAACFLFMGFSIYGSALFTALSNGRVSAILSFLRTLVFVVASVLLLPYIMGLDGVWIAIPVAELLGFLVTLFFLWKLKDVYRYT